VKPPSNASTALPVAAEDLAGTRSGAADALASRIPNASTNTRVWVPICFLSLSLSNVLRRPPIYTVCTLWAIKAY
jgi:hypothetical protein